MKLSDLDRQRPIRLSEGTGFLGILAETAGVGKIIKGVNTTVDVGVDAIPRQAAKMGFKTSRYGVPPIANTNGNVTATAVKKTGTLRRSR